MKARNIAIFLLIPCISLFVLFPLFHKTVYESAAQAGGGSDYTSGEMWKGAEGLGKGVYMMNCVPCHGESGKGDGPLSYDFPEGEKPRNHTDSKYMSTRSDKDLYKVIDEGGEAVGRSAGMPAWRGQLNDQEIKAVIKYLRELCKCEYKGK